MSAPRHDWLAGTTLEQPREEPKPRAEFSASVREVSDMHDQLAVLAEHLEKEARAREAMQAEMGRQASEIARQAAVQVEMAKSFAATQQETERRVAAEQDARLALGALTATPCLRSADCAANTTWPAD